GYNMPFTKNYAKPLFSIISEDPKLKPLEQDAEYHFTTGFPGPLTPAAEVYQQFVMVDALAQFATDKMDLEQTVKWAEEKIKAICATFVPPLVVPPSWPGAARHEAAASRPTAPRPAVLPSRPRASPGRGR